MFNKTQRRKTGGSFNSFITADNNRAHYESGKTRKGIDVKLKKDRSGNPTAWLIGGDAPWDDSFEELKKGAKGGRYKAFIAELLKTYPRFNNFTQTDKGIQLSHAMFCKLFMRDSVLGRMYPRLIAKVNKTPQLKCSRVNERADKVNPVVRANPVVPVNPVVRANPVVPVKPVVPVVKPVARDQNFTRQSSLDQSFPRQGFPRQGSLGQSFTRRQSFPRQSSLGQSFTRRQSSLGQSFTRQGFPRQSFTRRQSSLGQSFLRQGFPRQSSTRRQGFPQQIRRMEPIYPAIQDNVRKLTDMGFKPQFIVKALMKHNNNLDKAIEELLTMKNLEHITHNERMAQNGFTTTVQLLKLIRKKFTIRDNGGSGDCLFLSLAETLMRAHKINYNPDLPTIAFDLRQKIVKYVMSHLDNYFIEDSLQTFRNAIQGGVVVNGQTLYMRNYEPEMRNKSTFGTELEISAAAQIYKMNIYVVNTNGIGWDQLYIGDPHKNANTWYILNMNKGHYASLLCDDELI